jgi:hypothetical protein
MVETTAETRIAASGAAWRTGNCSSRIGDRSVGGDFLVVGQSDGAVVG